LKDRFCGVSTIGDSPRKVFFWPVFPVQELHIRGTSKSRGRATLGPESGIQGQWYIWRQRRLPLDLVELSYRLVRVLGGVLDISVPHINLYRAKVQSLVDESGSAGVAEGMDVPLHAQGVF
jgi:hypothetical protein